MTGYVLAGGRSSRMGRSKAELSLGGRSLLQHAVAKLRKVCSGVAVVGGGSDLPAGVRGIPDVHGGCGPLGGMEAALRDEVQGQLRDGTDGWAMFLPVDVPFVPDHLLSLLASGLGGACRAGFFLVDGTPQPLVSAVHTECLPPIERAVAAGQFKVRPALESAARELAGSRGSEQEVLRLIPLAISNLPSPENSSKPDRSGSDLPDMWFANVNTPEEWARAQAAWDERTGTRSPGSQTEAPMGTWLHQIKGPSEEDRH